MDAQEPGALYGDLRSPVRQVSAPQTPLDYVRGGFVRACRCLAQWSAYMVYICSICAFKAYMGHKTVEYMHLCTHIFTVCILLNTITPECLFQLSASFNGTATTTCQVGTFGHKRHTHTEKASSGHEHMKPQYHVTCPIDVYTTVVTLCTQPFHYHLGSCTLSSCWCLFRCIVK